MRRINLSVYNFAGSLRIMAHFFLKIEDLSKSIPIRAIVDTGSPMTLVGSIDLTKMRISKIQLNKIIGKHKDVNIGGGKMKTKTVEKSKLLFGENLEFDLPVEFPIEGQNNPQQPSLLGVDFLLKTKAKLFFDPTEKIAYLEMEE